ncbi:hypothetical protein [Streptomyces melanogenes]|uniref:hypothetical protein n=1 Tax=Streptomyces melanogenes TaxID=67326 RepID=UPI00167CCA02|nr:hypothetical protein [Streptomyces melanogenes]GGP52603.1 hypothetical protein GCM10010278_31920 [Streptomyces melanogenes]
MTRPPTTRPTDGPADNDIPRAPESSGAWDIRSEALLADPVPKRPTGVRGQRLPFPPIPRGNSASVEGSSKGAANVSRGAASAARTESIPANSARPASGSPWETPAAHDSVAAEDPTEVEKVTEVDEPTEADEPTAPRRSAPPDQPSAGPQRPRPRRGPADPVRALMHRHRDLCERAVDPLEIAAGLEAHGVTDRTAARFRHRDVFSLAEELYARVPRGTEPPRHDLEPAPQPAGRPFRVLRALLPGALCALTVTASRITVGGARLAAIAAGAAAVGAAFAYAVRRGPLRTGRGAGLPWALWLAAYAVAGNGLLDALVAGGPDGGPVGADGWGADPAAAVGLTLAVAPATWCARLFAVRARRGLATSRGLEEFTGRSRPLLLGAVALFLTVLAAILLTGRLAYGHGSFASAAAPGALLFLARLLTLHGFAPAAAAGLRAAACAEAAALALVLAGRLPGCGVLARPVTAAVEAGGAGAVPAAICGAVALALLVRATAVLARASAHSVRPPTPEQHYTH